LNVLTCRSPSKKPRLWKIMQLHCAASLVKLEFEF
jgi:hypothetical protein